MKIATLINCHGGTDLVFDTLESITKYVSNDYLILVDGFSWEKWGQNLNVENKIKGLNHGDPQNFSATICSPNLYQTTINTIKAPYKNLVFGISNLYDKFPNHDWYCYTESDVLFCSNQFKKDLRGWATGFDLRYYQYELPLFKQMTKFDFKHYCYLLGCCVFYHHDFIKKLKETKMFETIINWTSCFDNGFFPEYAEQNGYDFGEILMPSMADYLGGEIFKLGEFGDKYPVQFKPEIEDCDLSKASIVHPSKNAFGYLRKKAKLTRQLQ